MTGAFVNELAQWVAIGCIAIGAFQFAIWSRRMEEYRSDISRRLFDEGK